MSTRRGRRPAQQRAEQLDGRRVGPVEVVEHEHERLRRRELLEQRAHRAVAAVALVLERHVAARSPSAVSDGKTCASSVRTSSSSAPSRRGSSPSQVLVERVHEDRERQVALELGCRAGEDELPARVRASGELGEQARLADPRLADQLDRRGATAIELVEEPIERTELLGAPDEVLG